MGLSGVFCVIYIRYRVLLIRGIDLSTDLVCCGRSIGWLVNKSVTESDGR